MSLSRFDETRMFRCFEFVILLKRHRDTIGYAAHSALVKTPRNTNDKDVQIVAIWNFLTRYSDLSTSALEYAFMTMRWNTLVFGWEKFPINNFDNMQGEALERDDESARVVRARVHRKDAPVHIHRGDLWSLVFRKREYLLSNWNESLINIKYCGVDR